MEAPPFDAAAPLQFVVNGKAGSSDADATRATIGAGLREAGYKQVRYRNLTGGIVALHRARRD